MAQRGKTDWAAVERDYISTDTSLRKLAARYGVAPTTITRKAKNEHWSEKRERYAAKMRAAQAEAEGKAKGELMAAGMLACMRAAMSLLSRIEQDLDDPELPIGPKDYKSYSGAIRDIRDVLAGDLDVERKQAEIEAIRARLPSEADGTITVLLGAAGEYAV